MCILPFESAFWCFVGVVVYLSCIWLFSVLFGFFEGWSGLFCLWLPGNPGSNNGRRFFAHVTVERRHLGMYCRETVSADREKARSFILFEKSMNKSVTTLLQVWKIHC